MTRRAIMYICCVVIVIGGIGVGIYFVLQSKTPNGPKIALYQAYYASEMRPGAFVYPDATNGTPTKGADGVISLADNKSSYCKFEDDFKTFHIHFSSGSGSDFYFIVTKIKNGKKGLSATIQNVYFGDIVTYKLTTTPSQIIMKSMLKYTVKIATDDFSAATTEEIYWANSVIMTFDCPKESA